MSNFSHTLDISQTDLEQRGQAYLFDEQNNIEQVSKIVHQKEERETDKKLPALTEDDPASPSSSFCE
jgi:hypothetical protein